MRSASPERVADRAPEGWGQAGPRSRAFLDALAMEFPGLRVIDKSLDGPSLAIDVALRLVTFGAQRAYRTNYVTTLGRSLYVPPGFWARGDLACLVVLRHEAVHLRQFARFGWVGMALLYGVPIVPMGLAYGRARLEWEAYAETLRATAEVFGLEAAQDTALHEHIVRQFTSGAYGWMWPFPGVVRGWIRQVVSGLRSAETVPTVDQGR